MTVTALPTAAEAPDDRVPRRFVMQPWFAAHARDIEPGSAQNENHRTWLELVGPYAFRDAWEQFQAVMHSHVGDAIAMGQLPRGGFLADDRLRDKALRAAFAAGCAEILAGEVGQS